MSYICFDNVCKFYKNGDNITRASDGISFTAEKGELVVIVGPSGAGKTTVLNMLGGMDRCDSGDIILDGEKVSEYGTRRLTEYRRYDVGFVFQFYNLVQNLTALENVELASEICREPLGAAEALKSVGLEGRMNNFPAQLSGGEQQRVSIARALAKNPKILLCDEPTGALDYKTSKEILDLIERVNKKYGNTVILVTHNDAIKRMADRVIRLRDGMIRSDELNAEKLSAMQLDW